MTTIAIDRDKGTVAFDSRITVGTEIVYNVAKAWFSKKHPVIYAGAGQIAAFHAAAHFLDHSKELPWDADKWWDSGGFPNLGDHTWLAVVTFDNVYMIESPHWYPIESRFVTMGSGSQAALVAMLLGKSAEEAVEIACQVDTGSGLPVNVLHVEQIPLLARK